MRGRMRCVPTGVEEMEARAMLSAGLPTLTMNTLNGVAAEVQSIANRFATTDNTARANAALARLAARIPYGVQQLAPTWRADTALDASGTAQAGAVIGKQLLGALYRDVLQGVGAGTFRVVGPGSEIFTALSPGSGLPGSSSAAYDAASVNILNQTTYRLNVRITLQGSTYPITQIISPATNPPTYVLFDFGSMSTNSMTITVSNANGNYPPTFTYQLPQPGFNTGYHGAVFDITTMGSGGVFVINGPYPPPS
jgi:hypothetical protein